ncbi:hypothetical protein KY289_005051 [Solanum tuberosum]|nr:hypothetical protein KY289_005051 [Solanum tuberosum]
MEEKINFISNIDGSLLIVTSQKFLPPPLFNGENLLKNFRGKNFMFVGDSLSSNQWQSLACMLHAAVPNSNYTFDSTKERSVLSFPEFKFTVTFLKDGFLVDLVVEKVGRVLKLDTLSQTELWDYFQVGDKLYKEMDHMAAYKIALTTWAKWIDSNINPAVTKVFFQGISAVHARGKDWNEPQVKDCSGQTKPIEGSTYPGERYRGEAVVKSVLSNMTKPVNLLDITLLTQLRKDGHPSRIASGGLNDCSHWCVAGVPDAWNELLYTILLQK